MVWVLCFIFVFVIKNHVDFKNLPTIAYCTESVFPKSSFEEIIVSKYKFESSHEVVYAFGFPVWDLTISVKFFVF